MSRIPARLAALGYGLALALVWGCGDGPSEPGGAEKIEALPRALSASEEQVLQAVNQFGFGLLGELSRETPDSNIFISPLSASMALGMTLNGAANETFEAMRSALAFGDLSEAAINQSYRDLIDLLRGLDPRVTFGIGNSIWYREGFPVEGQFRDATSHYFDAEVRALDFSDPASADVMNAWVERETAGRIKDIVAPPIDPQTVMFLINAIYFKGTWTYEFEESATEEAPFYRADGTTVPVKLMVQEADLLYTATELYQAAELPYGGEAFAMTVVLPREGVSLNALVDALDAGAWGELLADARVTGLELHLPRFRMEYEKVLNGTLTALGMGIAFTDGADFSRIAQGWDLFISSVKQKSFVEVNEEGTEAAAATVVEIRETSAGGGSPILVRIDRPFLFAIRERLSGTLLFIGQLTNPPAN